MEGGEDVLLSLADIRTNDDPDWSLWCRLDTEFRCLELFGLCGEDGKPGVPVRNLPGIFTVIISVEVKQDAHGHHRPFPNALDRKLMAKAEQTSIFFQSAPSSNCLSPDT